MPAASKSLRKASFITETTTPILYSFPTFIRSEASTFPSEEALTNFIYFPPSSKKGWKKSSFSDSIFGLETKGLCELHPCAPPAKPLKIIPCTAFFLACVIATVPFFEYDQTLIR